MRPNQLRASFAPKVSPTYIEDRIWHVAPPYRDEGNFHFPGWEAPELFGNMNPVHIEFCSGNGLWIAERAKLNPHVNWVAVEMKFARVRKIWSKIKNHQLANLIVVNGEALTVAKRYFPRATAQEIYINFPDPWPKKHHAKNRLIQTPFVEELARIVVPAGAIVFVTDDPGYSQWTLDAFGRSFDFENDYSFPYYRLEWPEYGLSTFEALWRQRGKSIRYHRFRRQ
jgi:tRNA (guanine-N7-)-methyltransferase